MVNFEFVVMTIKCFCIYTGLNAPKLKVDGIGLGMGWKSL